MFTPFCLVFRASAHRRNGRAVLASKLNLSSRDHGRFFTAQQADFIRTYSAAVNPGNMKTGENEGGKGRREICKWRLTMWERGGTGEREGRQSKGNCAWSLAKWKDKEHRLLDSYPSLHFFSNHLTKLQINVTLEAAWPLKNYLVVLWYSTSTVSDIWVSSTFMHLIHF